MLTFDCRQWLFNVEVTATNRIHKVEIYCTGIWIPFHWNGYKLVNGIINSGIDKNCKGLFIL